MIYTKGEWEVKEDNLGCKEIFVENYSGLFTLEKLGFTHGLSDEDEDLGNARLIAAAPNMYEALKEAKLQIEYLQEK
jgi:hypothetical protein